MRGWGILISMVVELILNVVIICSRQGFHGAVEDCDLSIHSYSGL